MASLLASANSVQVVRGASVTIQLHVTDGSSTAPAPVDLTAAKLVLTVKERITDSLPLIQKTTDSVGEAQIVAPTQGLVQFFLSPMDTQDRDPKKYVFDVWVILSNGKRLPVVQPSDFIVVPGVTILR